MANTYTTVNNGIDIYTVKINSNGQQTARKSPLKSFMSTITQGIDDLQEVYLNVEEGISTIESLLDESMGLVSDFADTYSTAIDKFVGTLDDSSSGNGDVSASGEQFSTTKTDAIKACGNTNIIGNMLQGLLSFKDSIKTSIIPGIELGLANTIDSWSTCVGVAYDSLKIATYDASATVDDIIKLANEVYNTLNTSGRPYVSAGETSSVDEIITILNQTKSSMADSIETFRGRNYFDKSAWDAAVDSIDEAGKKMGKLNTDSEIETKGASKLYYNTFQIRYKYCALNEFFKSLTEISNNMTTLSQEKPTNQFLFNVLAFIDRLVCHIDYVVKKLDTLKQNTFLYTAIKSIDLTLQLREISLIMANSKDLIAEGIRASNRGMYYTPTVNKEDATAYIFMFSTLIEGFIEEAFSLSFSSRSVARLKALLAQLEEIGAKVKEQADAFTGGFIDEQSKAQEALQNFNEVRLAIVNKYGPYMSAMMDAYKKGDYQALSKFFLGSKADQLFELIKSSGRYKNLKRPDKVKLDAVETKSANNRLSKDIVSYYKSRLTTDLNEKRKRVKVQRKDENAFTKWATGVLDQIKGRRESLAVVKTNLMKNYPLYSKNINDFKLLLTGLISSDNIGSIGCGRKL